MDKDEILEKSRNENSKQDEYGKDINKKCGTIGLISFCVVCFVLITVEPLFGKEVNPGYGVIFTTVNVSIWLYKGIKLKDKHYIIISIVWLFAAIVSVFKYIMSLMG